MRIAVLLLMLIWLPAVETTGTLVPAVAGAAAMPSPGQITIGDIERFGSGDVPRFGSLELRINLTRLTATKPYETRTYLPYDGIDLQATFTGPDGQVWYIPAYYDGTDWRLRFSPNTHGQWTFSIRAEDRSGVFVKSGLSFTCAGTNGHGWVRVDGRWFRHADGTAFCPVPHNIGWQDDVQQPAFTTLATEAPAGSAPRLVSFWLSQPWSATANRKIIERIDWSYDQTTCAYIDSVVRNAEAAGVYLMPSLWIHGQLRDGNVPDWDEGDWGDQPYSTLGITAAQFFNVTNGGNDTEQWIRQKNFYRYVIARWGSSPSIAGWVGMVELNGTDGFILNNTNTIAWTAAVDDWFVANDPYRSHRGKAPVCFSLTDEGVGTLPLDPGGMLSTRAVDSYAKKLDDIDIADLLAYECRLMGGTKPVVITEFGGFIHEGASQPLHLHNGIWASFMAGAAMPAMQWCDLSYTGLLTIEMRNHLAHLAKFIGVTSWLSDNDQDLLVLDTGSRTSTVEGWSRSIIDRGMAWIHRYSGNTPLLGTSSHVPCTNGDYAVWWYDTWSGVESDPIPITVDNESLPLTVPATSNADAAVTWQRYPLLPTSYTVSVQAGERHVFSLVTSTHTTRITSLPAHGRLWQTADGVTAGAEITTVPTDVTDPARRVIYRAPANLGLESFTFAAVDARLSRTATASITVTNPPPGSSIVPIEDVPGAGGCGAGALAGLGLLGMLGLRRRRAGTA